MNGIADILRESSLKPAKSVPQPMWEVPGVEPDFDVIIIGGGVAGTVAAYQLSRAGHDVLLIERGQEPGSKNLSGAFSIAEFFKKYFQTFCRMPRSSARSHATS